MSDPQALVVDDSRSARKVLERMLQKANLEVATVEHAEAAMEYLQEHQPAIIFMDHMMPGMDGLAAPATIKQQPQLAHIPTIMYTSKDDEDYIAQAKACGASDVLAKPAKQADLEKIINMYLAAESSSDEAAQPAPASPAATNDSTTETVVEPIGEPVSAPQVVESIKLEPAPAASTEVPNSNTPQAISEQDVSNIIEGVESKLRAELEDQFDERLEDIASNISTALMERYASTEAQLKDTQAALAEVKREQANLAKPLVTPAEKPAKADEKSPQDTFKAIQPLVQRLSMQVAQKLMDVKVQELTDKLEKAENKVSDLQTRHTQQNKQYQTQISHLKMVAYSGAITAALALIGTAIVLVS